MPPSFLKPLYHAVKHDATPTSGNTRSCESRGAEGCREVFQKGIREGWLVQNEREIRCVEEKWLAFKDAVIKCAGGACVVRKFSKRGIRKGSEWWNEETERLVRMKRNMYEVWLQGKCNENCGMYKMIRNEVKRAVRRAKEQADGRWGGGDIGGILHFKQKNFLGEVKKVREGMNNLRPKPQGHRVLCNV